MTKSSARVELFSALNYPLLKRAFNQYSKLYKIIIIFQILRKPKKFQNI